MKFKKLPCLIIAVVILFSVFSFRTKNIDKKDDKSPSAHSVNYQDGNFTGYSQATYTSEPFWGYTNITIENGAIAKIYFTIRDTSCHEPVDSMYGANHYSNNAMYMQQCVNDGHGIEIYPKQFIESQDINNIDAISGATWSYNIFTATVKEALVNNPPTTINNSFNSKNASINAYLNKKISSITFEYTLNNSGTIKLGFFDINGKLVKQLVNQKQDAGQYIVYLEQIPVKGIYFYQLQFEHTTTCKKIVCQ